MERKQGILHEVSPKQIHRQEVRIEGRPLCQAALLLNPPRKKLALQAGSEMLPKGSMQLYGTWALKWLPYHDFRCVYIYTTKLHGAFGLKRVSSLSLLSPEFLLILASKSCTPGFWESFQGAFFGF